MDRLTQIKEMLFAKCEVRKSDAQKTAFIDWVRGYAKTLGFEMQIEESGKLIRTRNLVFGDAEHAKTLITAHYDTCARMPFPNFLTPNCWPVIILTQILLPAIPFFALGLGVGFLAGGALGGILPEWAAEFVALALYFVIVGGLMGVMLFGPENPHTANDNTSGVAAVLRLMHEFAGREDVAFILFDNEEKGLIGSSAFVKRHPKQQKEAFVVNLDCISDGDTLLFVASKAAGKEPLCGRIADALAEAAPRFGKRGVTGTSPKVFYPSDQKVFLKGTAFAALKGRKVLYLDRIHTDKDTVFDMQDILCLVEVLKKAV